MKNSIRSLASLAFLGVAILFTACNETSQYTEYVPQAPVVTSFEPQSGNVGTLITVTGENLENIDKVQINGIDVAVKYKVSSTKVVIVADKNASSGKITIINKYGTATSNDSFTYNYAAPTLTKVPASAKANDVIELIGTNFSAATQVFFDDVAAAIIAKTETDMTVKVPVINANSTKVSVEYSTGASLTKTSAVDMVIVRPQPTVTGTVPTSVQEDSPITISGTNLSLVEKVMVGTVQANITAQTATSVTFTIPKGSFPDGKTAAPLKFVYYTTSELVVSSTFEVSVPAVLYWSNIMLTCNDATQTNNFLLLNEGTVWSPCDYVSSIKTKPHIYITWSSSSLYIQFNNPSAGANQIKNFKCNGTALPADAVGCPIIKYKVLKVANGDVETQLIAKVKNKQIDKIDNTTWAGLTTTTSSPRTNAAGSLDFVNGDVIMFQLYDAAGTTVVKTGFIEVTNINNTGASSSQVTFNYYFQKQ